MSESTRYLPAPIEGGRVETGPTQFGSDWTGLFIRGDDCHHYLQALMWALAELEARGVGPSSIYAAILMGLVNDLQSTNESRKEG